MFLLFVYLTPVKQWQMILVYSKEISPRLEYTVRLLFHDILRSEATLTNDPVFFIPHLILSCHLILFPQHF